MTDPSLTIVNSREKNDLGRIRMSKIGSSLVKYGKAWQKNGKKCICVRKMLI